MVEMSDGLRAARVEGSKRHGLYNTRLRTHDTGETTTRILTSTAELRETLTQIFGIQLPVNDRLEPALEKALLWRDEA